MKNILLIAFLILCLSCSKNESPTCEITQPENNSTFVIGQNVATIISAEDLDGLIEEVSLYVDSQLIETINHAPFEFSISTSTIGTGDHILKAIVLDNELGESSDQINISIEPLSPIVSTGSATEVTNNSIVCGGDLIDVGEDPSIECGICWSKNPNPTIDDNYQIVGDELGVYTTKVDNLDPNTGYYLNAYGKNTKGTSYGEEIFVKTYDGSITDIDGNTYWTTTIGDQTWMAENLKVKHYSNGSEIPNVQTNIDWASLSDGAKAYSIYDNQENNEEIFGLLYTWGAAMNGENPSDSNPSDIQGICPDGWHLPSEAEWKQLVIFLGLTPEEADQVYFQGGVVGGKLKEMGYTHWITPNGGATNESGFTALPAGIRNYYEGGFTLIGERTFWWSTSVDNHSDACTWGLFTEIPETHLSYDSKQYGNSVRCVKN